MQELVDEITQLGHVPTQSKNASVEEKRLAVRLSKARKAGSLTSRSPQPLKMEELLQQVRDLGRYLKESRRDAAERQLAEKLRKASKAKQVSPEQEAEFQALQ